MMMNKFVTKKSILSLLLVCLGFSVSGLVMAAGYGLKGEQTQQSKAIQSLLSSNNNRINALIGPSKSTASKSNLPLAKTKGKKSATTKTADKTLGPTTDSQQAFSATVHNLMPLTPQQIRTLRYLFDKTQRAATAYPGTPPRPTSTSVMVNMSPGATPPVIRLRAGYVTSLVFLDSTGQPWPIVAYDLGDPKAFSIAPHQPNGKSDTLLVQALDNYKSGNLAVMLKGMHTPIMITLMPGQKAVDYRVDLRVPGLGPNAKVSASGLPATTNPQLINFLDGVPPQGAKELTVSGGTAQAWEYNDKLFLRTRMTVLSPSWISTMSSPDGTHVYELMNAPVVLASQRGQMVQLSIKGL